MYNKVNVTEMKWKGDKMNNKYICQLPSKMNLEIYSQVKDALYKRGFRKRELFDQVEFKMSGTIQDLEGIINVSKLLGK